MNQRINDEIHYTTNLLPKFLFGKVWVASFEDYGNWASQLYSEVISIGDYIDEIMDDEIMDDEEEWAED